MIGLTGARLVDGTGNAPRENVTITIEGDRIRDVCDGTAGTSGLVDVSGRTVVPGLVEAHVHMSGVPVPKGLEAYGVEKAARDFIASGITTVRDLGAYGRWLFDLRDAIELGLCIGPRLILCGQIVAASSAGALTFGTMYRAADGPVEMRKAAREQRAQGADFIKVMATGALNVAHENIDPAQTTREELEAVVDEAQRLRIPVAAHAEGVGGIRMSVEVGVNTLEHGEEAWKAPEILAAMAEKQIILVPTLSLFPYVATLERLPRRLRERAKRLGEDAQRTVQAAKTAGVLIAMGADIPPHGANAREVVLLCDAGLSPMEGIVSATSIGARACGISETVGTVTPGMTADLLVLDGDPLKDVEIFTRPERLWLVIKDGVPVAGTVLRELETKIPGIPPTMP
jgi:imidazolonepropionase-like amidohydrolase